MKITSKLLVVTLVVVVICGIFYYFQFDKFNQSDNVAQTNTNNDDTAPIIDSINPISGPVGTIVQIRGKNLSGFEGDLGATFEQSNGKEFYLVDKSGNYPKTGGSLITVIVKEPCEKGDTVIADYSGKSYPCEYEPMTPGVYKVYTEPWGKKSNEVIFTVL